jgi:hypothetical protein
MNQTNLIGDSSVSIQDLYPKGFTGQVLQMLGTQVIWGNSGGSGDVVEPAYETVSKNLKSYSSTFSYNGSGDLSTITYTVPGGNIIKTFNYASGDLASIVLSGNTPAGINLTKTLSYTSGNLTGVSYS